MFWNLFKDLLIKLQISNNIFKKVIYNLFTEKIFNDEIPECTICGKSAYVKPSDCSTTLQ